MMNDFINSWIAKAIMYLIMAIIALAAVTSTGCYGLIDSIFIGWRDETGCVSLSPSCFIGGSYGNNSDEGAYILFLLLIMTIFTFYIMLFIKKIISKNETSSMESGSN